MLEIKCKKQSSDRQEW